MGIMLKQGMKPKNFRLRLPRGGDIPSPHPLGMGERGAGALVAILALSHSLGVNRVSVSRPKDPVQPCRSVIYPYLQQIQIMDASIMRHDIKILAMVIGVGSM